MSVYDQVQYGDAAYYLTHPGHMAAMARLCGLRPPLQNVRVLELGCGSGFNLLAMSQSMPGSTFTGVDLSGVEIAHGQAIANGAGISAVSLIAQSVDDFQPGPVEYDYIIAHGLYTWVPAHIRDAVLGIIARHLAPGGIAYISYNTNPGWRLRGLVRDAMRFFAGPGADTVADVARAREAMKELTGNLLLPGSPFAQVLQAEWAQAEEQPDSYLLHEYLVPEASPVSFEEFTAQAAAHGLQFLAESRYATNSFAQPDAVLAQLDNVGPDRLRREQYLDWLAGRYFRQTLLCRASQPLAVEAVRNAVLELGVIATHGPDVSDRVYGAVLAQLLAHGPAPTPARDLEAAILAALGMSGMEGMVDSIVASVLVGGWRDGMWTLRADSPALADSVRERPVACPLARLQARTTAELTNRLHRPVTVGEEERALLAGLDGSRTVAELGEGATMLPGLAAKGLLAG